MIHWGIGLALLAWATVSAGQVLTAPACGLLLLWPGAASRVGGAWLAWADYPQRQPLALVLGTMSLLLGLLVLKAVLPVPIGLTALAVVLLAYGLPARGWQRDDVWVVTLALGLASLWAQPTLRPTRSAGTDVVYRPWSDYFTHAGFTARFLQPTTLGSAGDFELAGAAQATYHFASYTLPAAVAELGGTSAYASVCGVWTPVGYWLSALAAYSVGSYLGGRRAGWWALAALSWPDARTVGLGVGVLSYHWAQAAMPGGLYGVALAGCALRLVLHGCSAQRPRWLVLGTLLSGAVLGVKAHIGLALVPVLGLILLLAGPGAAWGRAAFVGSGCVLAGLLLSWADARQLGPTLRLTSDDPIWYFQWLATLTPSSPLTAWVAPLRHGAPVYAHLSVALGLLLAGTFGLWLVLLPGAGRWRGVPLGTVLGYALVPLLLAKNTGYGHPDELVHRPFVAAYALVVVWAACGLARHLRHPAWLLAASAGALVTAGLSGPRVHELRCPLPPPANERLRVPLGWVRVAEWLRTHTPVTDIVQESAYERLDLPHVGHLADRRMYLTRPALWCSVSPAYRHGDWSERTRQVDALLRTGRTAAPIVWLVLRPADHPAWAEHAEPAFAADGFRVYCVR
jgi:hypothetical protein